jgi:hypothetical protein
MRVRDGCTSGNCMALALLRDPELVRANLSAQTFDRYVDRYLQTWGQHSDAPMAEVAPSATTVLAASQPAGSNHKKAVVDADFPSAASIPAIGIMNPEPKTSPANAAADAKMRGTGSTRTPSRKNSNSPTQALASPAASLPATSLAPPVDPVWVPGTAPITPQPSPPAGNKGPERVPEIQLTDYRDKTRARIPVSSGLFAPHREISVCVRLRGGAGRTRTSNQTVISR